MHIGGLPLPPALVEALASRRLHRKVGSWQMVSTRDCFGHQLETELGEVYATQEAIEEATRGLPTGFEPEYAEADEQAGGDEARPGGIAYIRDFSRIVCFAISGDGAPFCLDYRESLEQPAVIWWDDIYWRKIAPDFAAFVGLFDLSEG